jgi:hypothetical protein
VIACQISLPSSANATDIVVAPCAATAAPPAATGALRRQIHALLRNRGRRDSAADLRPH